MLRVNDRARSTGALLPGQGTTIHLIHLTETTRPAGRKASAIFMNSTDSAIQGKPLPAVVVMVFWAFRQATPGKMLLSLRIVDAATGGALSVGQCVGRYFAYVVSTLPLGLGFVWVAFDKRKQGWHDKLAGTVVVKRARRARAG